MKAHVCGAMERLFVLICAVTLPGIAAASGTIELTVVKNDTLISICKKYLQNPAIWQEVGRINHLKNADLLQPGQRLMVPVHLLKGVPMDGRVVFVRSEVLTRDSSKMNWIPLKNNDIVRQGSSIKTGSDAAVEVAFEDGTSFFQQPDSILELNASQLKGSNHIFQRLLLAAGRIVMKVRHATGRDSRIEIRTPSATAVARGTDFRVSARALGATTSEVLQGVIDVEAMQRAVVVHEGEGTVVTKGNPPMQPRKLLDPPALLDRQPVYRSMPFKLTFEKIEGTVSHRLVLSRDQEGREAVLERVFKAGESPSISGLEDGTYYCRVLSIDALGLEGPPRSPEEIVIRSNPLPPFLQEPANGASFKGKSIEFRWLKVRDANSYQLQIADDSEFRLTPEKLVEVKDTAYVQKFSELGSKYFRIRSVAGDGFSGLWSDTIAFTLLPPPPSPELEKPALDGNRLRIRWRNQGDRFTYHVQLSRDEIFGSPLVDRNVTTPEITLEPPEQPGVYYVRTSTIDPEGHEGPFSLPQTFEVTRWWPYATGGALGVAGIILLILL
ncbi:MAG: FecR domain-containing protein [Desulfuromonadales bacterium]|nr:FecR domain-containing protein [Desulfuromonadales bacterium]